MNRSKNSKFHVLMFPWVSYGHFTPFLHLSNKFAERGRTVSFLLPKSAQSKVEQLNNYPDLIHFFPLLIPDADGLPPGTQLASDVPIQLHKHLFTAFDQTQDQFQSYLSDLQPQLVFYDLAYWVPSLVRARSSGCKSVLYTVVNTVTGAFYRTPSRKISSVEELMIPPPGYPSSRIRVTRDEASQALFLYNEVGGGLTFHERLVRGTVDSDAIGYRTCREFEGPFCAYIVEQWAKPVLLTGPALPELEDSSKLEEKWANWLDKFEAGSVVYYTFGTQIAFQKDQFQELVLGFQLSGLPFLLALAPPEGCASIEDALPDGFEERVKGRGWVYGGWVPLLA